jgi:hypothetical protein
MLQPGAGSGGSDGGNGGNCGNGGKGGKGGRTPLLPLESKGSEATKEDTGELCGEVVATEPMEANEANDVNGAKEAKEAKVDTANPLEQAARNKTTAAGPGITKGAGAPGSPWLSVTAGQQLQGMQEDIYSLLATDTADSADPADTANAAGAAGGGGAGDAVHFFTFFTGGGVAGRGGARSFFRGFDVTGNGKIDLPELLCGFGVLGPDAHVEHKLRFCFHAFCGEGIAEEHRPYSVALHPATERKKAEKWVSGGGRMMTRAQFVSFLGAVCGVKEEDSEKEVQELWVAVGGMGEGKGEDDRGISCAQFVAIGEKRPSVGGRLSLSFNL